MQATTQPTEVKQTEKRHWFARKPKAEQTEPTEKRRWFARKPKAEQTEPTEKRRWFARKPKAEQPKADAQPLIVPTMPVPPEPQRTRWQRFVHSLKTWYWAKSFVYWLVLSAGTASDLIFIVASLWISEYANVPKLILAHLSQSSADGVTNLATSAYIGLPIFIVFTAFVETLGHMKMWNRDKWARVWFVLFGLPALIFFMMDITTLSFSVARVGFTMPTPFVILRADSAFIYAFASLIYHFVGAPQEAERLALKDQQLAIAHQNMATMSREHAEQIARLTAEWQAETARLKAELDALKQRLAGSISQLNAAQSELNKSSESALEAYGDECVAWLKSGIKTANIEEITKFTGHTKRKIANAIERGNLQTSTRNKALVLVGSLIQWLAENAPKQSDTGPILHIVNAD